MSRLALLATAVSLTLVATPVLAQTFSGYNGNDTVATREQGNTALLARSETRTTTAMEQWRHSDHRAAVRRGDRAVAMATGNGWQSGPACGLYHDFNGRYTSVCGL